MPNIIKRIEIKIPKNTIHPRHLMLKIIQSQQIKIHKPMVDQYIKRINPKNAQHPHRIGNRFADNSKQPGGGG